MSGARHSKDPLLRFAALMALGIPLLGCVSSANDGAQVVAADAGVASAADPSAASEEGLPSGPVEPFPTDALIGNWGAASYREVKDRPRVEAQARAQCKLPYKIAKGPTDGVMMYFADDPKLYELKVKPATDGKVYIGFEGPPGGWQDREVLAYSGDRMELKFVDPEINGRYGVFIFVRCK